MVQHQGQDPHHARRDRSGSNIRVGSLDRRDPPGMAWLRDYPVHCLSRNKARQTKQGVIAMFRTHPRTILAVLLAAAVSALILSGWQCVVTL